MRKTIVSLLFILFSSSIVFSQDSLGILQIASEPAGAQIYIDDMISGSTPYTVPKIASGKHILKLTRDGYEDWISTIDISIKDSNKVYATLNKLRGQIQVNSDVKNAAIFLDSKYKGQAPMLIKEVEFGKHYIELRKYRYFIKNDKNMTFKDTIDINDNSVKVINGLIEKCWLTIDSNPSGAEINIDGKDVGTLPLEKKKITAGTSSLTIKKDGFETVDMDINVSPGKLKIMDVSLVPLSYSKILYRSVIFPGLGHLYAGKNLWGISFGFVETAAIGGALYMNARMSSASDTYTHKFELYKNAATEEEALRLHMDVRNAYNDVQDFEKYRNIFIGTAVAVWLYNIYDAYRLGKRYENNNEMMSVVSHKPRFCIRTTESGCIIGIRIAL